MKLEEIKLKDYVGKAEIFHKKFLTNLKINNADSPNRFKSKSKYDENFENQNQNVILKNNSGKQAIRGNNPRLREKNRASQKFPRKRNQRLQRKIRRNPTQIQTRFRATMYSIKRKRKRAKVYPRENKRFTYHSLR